MMDFKIMLVDDDDSVRETLGVMLASAGYETVPVDSGAKCLDVLRGGFKGLILLDVMMPDMDGWQTVDAIIKEELNDEILICMLTALVEPGEDMNELAQYILDYVRKPFTMTGLLGAVDNAMGLLSVLT